MQIHVQVRDGRSGRDPSRVTDQGGEILAEFDSPRLHTEGERLTLPDGTEVEIIGVTEDLASGRQTLSVGNVWADPEG